jgi:hypothetical protein
MTISRKLLNVTVLIWILLNTSVVATRAIKIPYPLPESINALRLDKCQLPCWLGIIPGRTTFEDAKRILIEAFPPTETQNAAIGGGLIIGTIISANMVISDPELIDWDYLENPNTVRTVYIAPTVKSYIVVQLYLQSGLVQGVSIKIAKQGNHLPTMPTLSAIINTFGPPDCTYGTGYEPLGLGYLTEEPNRRVLQWWFARNTKYRLDTPASDFVSGRFVVCHTELDGERKLVRALFER